MSRTERLLALMQQLRTTRQPRQAHELAQALGVSLRTLYRDIDLLRAQGADIRGEAGVGYVLKKGAPTLPPLMFAEGEIEALVLGLRWVVQQPDPALAASARSVLAKVEAVLPARLVPMMEDQALYPVRGRVSGEPSASVPDAASASDTALAPDAASASAAASVPSSAPSSVPASASTPAPDSVLRRCLCFVRYPGPRPCCARIRYRSRYVTRALRKRTVASPHSMGKPRGNHPAPDTAGAAREPPAADGLCRCPGTGHATHDLAGCTGLPPVNTPAGRLVHPAGRFPAFPYRPDPARMAGGSVSQAAPAAGGSVAAGHRHPSGPVPRPGLTRGMA